MAGFCNVLRRILSIMSDLIEQSINPVIKPNIEIRMDMGASPDIDDEDII